MSPTDVSPAERSWILRTMYNLPLGLIIPDRCVLPWRAPGKANSLQQGKLGDGWPAPPTPLTRFFRFVPLRQVQAQSTRYNYELSLCSAGRHSYATLLEVFRDGMVWSGAQYPRDALSKGCNIQESSVGDTPVGDEITLHHLRLLQVRELEARLKESETRLREAGKVNERLGQEATRREILLKRTQLKLQALPQVTTSHTDKKEK